MRGAREKVLGVDNTPNGTYLVVGSDDMRARKEASDEKEYPFKN